LVIIDFSSTAETAMKQAIWLARQSGARITLVHSLPDLCRVAASASLRAKLDMANGEDETFQLDILQAADLRMKLMPMALNAGVARAALHLNRFFHILENNHANASVDSAGHRFSTGE